MPYRLWQLANWLRRHLHIAPIAVGAPPPGLPDAFTQAGKALTHHFKWRDFDTLVLLTCEGAQYLYSASFDFGREIHWTPQPPSSWRAHNTDGVNLGMLQIGVIDQPGATPRNVECELRIGTPAVMWISHSTAGVTRSGRGIFRADDARKGTRWNR